VEACAQARVCPSSCRSTVRVLRRDSGDYNYAFDYGAGSNAILTAGKIRFRIPGDEAHNWSIAPRYLLCSLSKRRNPGRHGLDPAEKEILAGLNSILLALKKEHGGFTRRLDTRSSGLREAVTDMDDSKPQDAAQDFPRGSRSFLGAPSMGPCWTLRRVYAPSDQPLRDLHTDSSASTRRHSSGTLADQRATFFWHALPADTSRS